MLLQLCAIKALHPSLSAPDSYQASALENDLPPLTIQKPSPKRPGTPAAQGLATLLLLQELGTNPPF